MIGWLSFRVTVLTWVVLILTVWNGLRLWTAIAWKAAISEVAPQVGPLYIGLTGAIWVAAGFRVLWSIWNPGRRSRQVIAIVAVVYSAWYWIDRSLLQQMRSDWLFVAGLNLLLLIWIAFSLKSRHFSREAYERESENTHVTGAKSQDALGRRDRPH